MIRNFLVILDVLTWHRMYMFPFWRKFHCEGKRDFFLPKANYTMKNLLNSLRPFFKFAKFSFGAESQWSILKNFIRKITNFRHSKCKSQSKSCICSCSRIFSISKEILILKVSFHYGAFTNYIGKRRLVQKCQLFVNVYKTKNIKVAG